MTKKEKIRVAKIYVREAIEEIGKAPANASAVKAKLEEAMKRQKEGYR